MLRRSLGDVLGHVEWRGSADGLAVELSFELFEDREEDTVHDLFNSTGCDLLNSGIVSAF